MSKNILLRLLLVSVLFLNTCLPTLILQPKKAEAAEVVLQDVTSKYTYVGSTQRVLVLSAQVIRKNDGTVVLRERYAPTNGATDVRLKNGSDSYEFIYFTDGIYTGATSGNDGTFYVEFTIAQARQGQMISRVVSVAAGDNIATSDVRRVQYYWAGGWINMDPFRLSSSIYINSSWFNTSPSLAVTGPTSGNIYSAVAGNDTFTLTGNASESDSGQTVSIRYRIDGGAAQTIQTFASPISNQAFSTTINAGSYAEGSHTIETWAEDNLGGTSAIDTRTFRVDKTGPSLFTPSATANSTTQITVSGTTIDPTSGGVSSGMHASPYRFYSSHTGMWTAWGSATSQVYNGLNPNQQYTFQMEARDAKDNVRQSNTVNRYTRANNASSIAQTGSTATTVTVTITPDATNTSTPEQYVELRRPVTGTVLATSAYSTSLTRTMNVAEVAEIWGITRNGDGVANAAVYYGTVAPNNTPTIASTSPTPGLYYSATAGHNTLTASGTVRDVDIGDILKVYYRIDGTNGNPGTQIGDDITADGTNQAYSVNIDVSALAEGGHNVYRWVEDNKGGKSPELSVNFNMDKTPPSSTLNLTGTGTYPNFSGPVTASYTSSESGGSGMASISATWSKDGGPATEFSTAATGTVNLTTPGHYVVQVVTTDNAGNTHTSMQNFVISSPDLTSLTMTGITLAPVFDSNTLIYTASVPFTTSTTDITVVASDATATISVNGVIVQSGVVRPGWSLAAGLNVFDIVVAPQGGGAPKTYQVTVDRALSGNNQLSGLYIIPGTTAPAFDPLTILYSATVEYGIDQIRVVADFAPVIDETVTITVNGVPVSPGVPSGAMALIVGMNQIDVEVTAQDGTIRLYQIMVSRQAEVLPSNSPPIEALEW